MPLNRLARRTFLRICVCLSATASFVMTGCGSGKTAVNPSGTTTPSAIKFTGSVHGGQQPVGGAHLYLYAVGTTDGGPAQSLLNTPGGYVTTNAQGFWTITGDYTCPANTSYVYALALGGNPGLAAGTNNSKLAMASILGSCASLNPGQFFVVNEVTTVVAASALAKLASSETQIASSSLTVVANAVARNNSLTDPFSGLARTFTPERTGSVPQAKINSLANSIAACVNSDGTASACAGLMNASGLNGTSLAPDTFNAALLIAQMPYRDPYSIYNLATASSPFEPTLSTQPNDWSLAVQYSGQPTGLGVGLTPDSATIAPGDTITLSSSGDGGAYLWSTSGAFGTITDPYGPSGQTSFCTDSNQISYVSNNPNLQGPSTDEVTVTRYQFEGCGGNATGSATAAITTTPPASVTTYPNLPTQAFTATIVLPSEVDLPLDSLTVLDSITQTTPDSSGTFSLPAYSGAPQVVIVDAPDGMPILLGWMDANHSTVDEGTTAEVLAFYALGGANMLAATDRSAAIAQIPQLGAFSNLVTTIDTELNNNIDAFAQPNANIRAALNFLFTQTTGFNTNAVPGPLRKARPQDVSISPTASSPQSGVSLSNILSSDASTTSNVTPFSTFLTNAYRRRTHYFVIKQKDTLSGQDTSSGAQIVEADVAATAGVSGGVTGALTDIIKAYFGNQPSAYAPVTSDPFDLPVDAGFDSTTYQIINVGAGGSGAARPVQLTSGQQATLVSTAINGFVSDALVPFINNVIIAGNDDAANSPISGSSQSAFILSLEKNIANIVNGLPGEQDKIVSGDYKTAVDDLLFNAGTQPLVSDAITAALQSAVPVASSKAAKAALDKFSAVLNAANAGLQVFDTAVYSAQIAGSDNVDVWTVTSTKFKATLTPAATTLTKLGSVQLQATALNVSNSPLLSYKWTIAAQSGQSLVGTLSEIGGAGRNLPDASGNTSACSSSGTWGYANNASQFQALTIPTTDSVTVTIYQGANCVAANQLTNTPSATITNNPNPNIVISPASSQIEAGENVVLTATFNNPKLTTQPMVGSWLWQLQGAGGGAVYGTLGNADGTASINGATFCSTSNIATYTSTQSDPVTSSQTDLTEATAYPQAGCKGTPMAVQPGFATVSTRVTPNLKLTPSQTTIQAGATVNLAVTFATQDTTGFSYQWGTSGLIGSLTDSGPGGSGKTGLLGYCTNSSTATFVTDPNQKVKEPISDFVTVAAYQGSGCVSNNQVGQPGSSQITLQPTPSVSSSGTQLLGQMVASDGFAYAIGDYAVLPYYGGPNWPALVFGDTIFQIQSDGSVKTIVSFTHKVHNNYTGGDDLYGDAISPLVEGPDDALYGLAASGGGPDNIGYFYKFSLRDYSVTILHTFALGDGSFGTDHYGNNLYVGGLKGPLVLANDGNFYVGGSGGIVRLSASGAVSIAYTAAGIASDYGPLIQGEDGNLYGTKQVFLVTDNNTGKVITPASISLFNTTLDGSATTLHTFDPPVTLYHQPNTPVVAGPDGAFYGTTRGERPGFGACELDYTIMDANQFSPCSITVGPATIFRFDPHGSFSTLYTFDSLADGTTPLVGMVAGPDGNLYGAASAGGDLGGECTTFPTTDELTIGTQVDYTTTGPIYGPPGPYRVADEGCGTIFRIKPSGGLTKLYQFQNGPEGRLSLGLGIYGNGTPQMLANLALDPAGDILGSSGFNLPGSYTVSRGLVFKLPLFDNGPIQMKFNQSAVAANTPVTLTWNVSNAFSLSAQQCYAHANSIPGGGAWAGKQAGVLDSSGYHGSATITPTAPGTYYYALTCGGTESSVAILNVQ